jgi:hypothetical protein
MHEINEIQNEKDDCNKCLYTTAFISKISNAKYCEIDKIYRSENFLISSYSSSI